MEALHPRPLIEVWTCRVGSGDVGISRFIYLAYLALLKICCHSMDIVKPPPQLTAVTLAGIDVQSKAQLEAWEHTMERHEEVALGVEMVVSRGKIEGWLEEIGKRVEG